MSAGSVSPLAHELKFFELSWLVELGDCLRPLLGKSYQNKNSTEEIGQWVSGKICAERNTSASFSSWYCLAHTVWINLNVYFRLYDWSWNYIVFSLSLLALCRVFDIISSFPGGLLYRTQKRQGFGYPKNVVKLKDGACKNSSKGRVVENMDYFYQKYLKIWIKFTKLFHSSTLFRDK